MNNLTLFLSDGTINMSFLRGETLAGGMFNCFQIEHDNFLISLHDDRDLKALKALHSALGEVITHTQTVEYIPDEPILRFPAQPTPHVNITGEE